MGRPAVGAAVTQAPFPPIAMLAELTHRCPLQCPYCSNPIDLLKADREMETERWLDVFEQVAAMGVLQVHLSGGEPTLRRDLEQFVSTLSQTGVYTNLITAGVGLAGIRLEALASAGLDHVQVSFQGANAETTARIGRHSGAHAQKLAAARHARALGLALTINAPIHRHNIAEIPDYIDLALSLGAERLEIANVQYAGWALLNRRYLLPDGASIEHQVATVEAARARLVGVLEIDFVVADHFAAYPKPCMGGWGRDAFVIAPDGLVLPCHAAMTIPSLRFERFGSRPLADIWRDSPAFNAFRGTDWMLEPCRSCERRDVDWGGCRCQALALAGDAAAADPVCVRSPLHARMAMLLEETLPPSDARTGGDLIPPFAFRRIGRT
ncbi:pyrroloquinoline quinone biosynthesis protein PqqE [Mesorhizobium sp. M0028]|uniref:pyrroloquinoline quinone biosynthesis protein PqqE n=1 Tax=Mesorhizobium sp. M0028 TaxID=2956849 RepID=UPI0033352D03